MSKRLESETNFMKIENRGVENLLFFDDFILDFGPQVRKSEQTAWEWDHSQKKVSKPSRRNGGTDLASV